jgi:hypothetical protein
MIVASSPTTVTCWLGDLRVVLPMNSVLSRCFWLYSDHFRLRPLKLKLKTALHSSTCADLAKSHACKADCTVVLML